MKKAGIIIVLFGLVLTLLTVFTFFTKEKVADIGPIEITRKIPQHLNWSPLVGITLMGFGGFVLFLAKKK